MGSKKLKDLRPYEAAIRLERAARIRAIVDEDFGGVQVRLAEKLGIGASQMGDVINGRDPIGITYLRRFEDLGYDSTYIYTGKARPTEKDTADIFGITRSDVIEKDGDLYLTVRQIANGLGTEINHIRKTINRNIDEFQHFGGGDILSLPFRTSGGVQEGLALNEQQVYILCMILRDNEKAREFRKHIVMLLDKIKAEKFKIEVKAEKKLQLRAVRAEKKAAENELKYICASRKIGSQRKSRYIKLKELDLNRKEAARALRIPYRTAGRMDAALKDITQAVENIALIIEEPKLKVLGGNKEAHIYELAEGRG